MKSESFGVGGYSSRRLSEAVPARWIVVVALLLLALVLVTNLRRMTWNQPDQQSSQPTLTKTVVLNGTGARCRGPQGTGGPECIFVADLDTPVFEGGHTLDLMGPSEARAFFESRQNDPNHGTYFLKSCLTNVSGKVFVFGPAGQTVRATRLERGSREQQQSLASCPPF